MPYRLPLSLTSDPSHSIMAQQAGSTLDNPAPSMAAFFDKKSVFITGAGGFVGAVLLETLLRCFPGIEQVYILLREKKGVSAKARKEQILKKEIFGTLKRENPNVFDKIKVVEGDITSLDLGISDDELDEIRANVSVVFHCAAIISFSKPLRFMLIQNLLGTYNVLQLCKSLAVCKAFVHTSTAYCNSNKRDVAIEEVIYRLQASGKKFLEMLKAGASDEALKSLASLCKPDWPNTYTFTKALTEDLIADFADQLPVAVVRPSIVISCWKGPMPGYIEEGSGIIDVSLGIGKGFIRVLHCDEDKIIDYIPVDIVANTLVSASWSVANKTSSSPLVVHCTSGDISPCTWGNFIRTLYNMQEKYPLPKMYQKPFLVMRRNKVAYWVSALVNHYAPAICIDFALMVLKKKPRLTKLYRFYDLALSYLSPFLTNEWRFRCDNFRTLSQQMSAKDSQMLSIDISELSIDSLSQVIKTGAPFYQWEKDKRELKDRIPIAHKRALLTNFIKWTFIIWFAIFFVFIFAKSVFRTTVF